MNVVVYLHLIVKNRLPLPLSQMYGQPLNRVLAGNYEYRMFLRCRHAAKVRFVKLRSDVLVKLQLLDNKRGQCSNYMHNIIYFITVCTGKPVGIFLLMPTNRYNRLYVI